MTRVGIAFAGTIALAGMAAWIGAGLDGPPREAWHLVFVTVAGLAAGALGLLCIGHLLGEEWLAPVRRELEALALTAPLAAVLAIPLGLHAGELLSPITDSAARAAYLAPDRVVTRSAVILALWSALAVAVVRAGAHRWLCAIGIALLLPTVTIAALDWVLAREAWVWLNLFGFAFGVSQLVAALALAILVALASRDGGDPSRLRSLEWALLTLALLTLWTWFSQFLIVWYANLPDEVSWYLVRTDEWIVLKAAGVLVPSLVAVLLMIPAGASRRPVMVAAALLVIHHLAHMVWLLRALHREPFDAPAFAVMAGLAALWIAWTASARASRPKAAQREGTRLPARSGSAPGRPPADERGRAGSSG